MLIKPQYLDARSPNALGVIAGCVPGHGGDIYWVKHPGGTVAAYCWSEFELAPSWETLPEEAPKGSGNLWAALQSDEL